MTAAMLLTGCSGDGTGTDTSDTANEDEMTAADEIETPVVVEKVDFTADNLEKYDVPEWYRDAKFGIFIHYGVYSVPAYGDEWYGHWMYMPGTSAYGGSDIYSYHKKTYGGVTDFGYKDFILSFLDELKKWESNGMADEWAALFEAAGAKYVMPVGIHHDSYALYASDVQTTYNSVTMAGIDYIGELQAAVKAHGMKFGISNHFAENDWFFDDKAGKGTDIEDEEYSELYGTGGDKTVTHVKKWYKISMEIIEKYHPDIIYYDFDLSNGAFNTYPDANRYLMLANYYNFAQTWDGCDGVVCNFKNSAFTESEAVLNKEREALGEINPTPWQTDTSVGAKSWGYTTNEVYRDGEEFIGALVDIVSKNGNLLLNIGPKADGTIPEDCRDALLTIGKWLGKYGDAIYATRPWLVYGEGSSQNSGDNYSYNGRDIRFTRSKDRKSLYITALGTPTGNKLTVKTLKKGAWDAEKIDKICLINGDERTPLEWEQTSRGLEIKLPKGIIGAYSVEVTFKDGGTIPALALDATDAMEAGNYENASGLILSHATEDGSDMTQNSKDGAWAQYRLDFGKSNTGFLASVSGASEGKIEIRRGDKNGELLGDVTVEKSKTEAYRKVSAQIKALDGKEVICLVFTGKVELNWFKFAEGKKINVKIEAEDFDAKYGSIKAEPCADGGENLGYVSMGDYAMFAGVDFGDGADKLYMRLAGTGQSCNIRIDAADGKIIASTGSVNTGGWGVYRTYEYTIDKITGVHDVYITYDTDWSSLNVNWFAFSDGSYVPDGYKPTEEDSKVKKTGEQLGAEFFDAKNGAVKAETCAEGGQNLGYVGNGDWVKYSGFDFGDGATKLSMRLAGLGSKLEVRLDSTDGEVIASFVPSTGDWSAYKTFEAELASAVTGTHDVYIVFRGASNVNWLRFE